jgi:hypothetical protein
MRLTNNFNTTKKAYVVVTCILKIHNFKKYISTKKKWENLICRRKKWEKMPSTRTKFQDQVKRFLCFIICSYSEFFFYYYFFFFMDANWTWESDNHIRWIVGWQIVGPNWMQ